MGYTQECLVFTEYQKLLRLFYSVYSHWLVQKEIQKKFDEETFFD
ncbi:hypothetical protein BH10BAC2_BH10BAC2_34240 [soil metagenome]